MFLILQATLRVQVRPEAILPQQKKKRHNSLADLIEQYTSLQSLDRGRDFYVSVLRSRGAIRDTVSASVKAGYLSRAQNTELPTAPFTAPPSPLNVSS